MSDRVTVPDKALGKLAAEVEHLIHVAMREGADHGQKCRGLRELERSAKSSHEAFEAFMADAKEMLEVSPDA